MLTPERAITNGIAILMVVFIAYLALSTGNPFLIVSTGLIPAGLLMIGQQRLVFVIALVLFESRLRVPAIPGNLELFHPVALVAIALCAGIIIIRKQSFRLEMPLRIPLVIFLTVIVFTMLYRGAGFMWLGGFMQGGMRYVHMIIVILFFLLSANLRLSARQWFLAAIGMHLIAFLPAISELIFLKTGFFLHYYFFQVEGSTLAQFSSFLDDSEGGRFQMMGHAGTALIILTLALIPLRPKNYPWLIAGVLISLGLDGLSGHRLSFLNDLMIVWVYGFLHYRKRMMSYLTVTVAVLLVTWIMVLLIGPHLPYTYQRMLSFVPFLDISTAARIDAGGTLDWRFEIWSRAWHEIPDFLLIGKGYAYVGAELDALPLSGRLDIEIVRALISIGYHNGPLSLLIGLGLMGFLSCLWLFFAALHRHWTHLNAFSFDEKINRLHLVMTAKLTVLIFSFLLLYGDAYYSVPKLIIPMVVLNGLYNLTNTENRKHAEANNIPLSTGNPQFT